MANSIQIPINITTGYAESGDKVKDNCLRIDQISYYMNAVFWAMNTASKGYNLLELQTDTELFTFPEFRQNVEMLSEIGIAISEQLTVYSVSLIHSDRSEAKTETKTLSSAEMISLLIKDASLPISVSDALTDAVVDLINKHGSEREFSPEFIAQLIESEKTSEVSE